MLGIVVIAGLFVYPKLTDPNRGLVKFWKQAGLNCLQSHNNLFYHIHPRLLITIDGEREPISANQGIQGSCMSEMHTHDGTGTLHLEPIEKKDFTLNQFLSLILKKPLQREGFTYQILVNGVLDTSNGEVVLEDHQELVIDYVSEGQESVQEKENETDETNTSE
ncbi:MAG: hypothetical protein COU08_04515 [Candidatus Harrisonbacteria bacterium CG10_big_fil_rev_8_21_14_0_10_42_17]|uniref:Uncharacterized protein n=1 Tax=Candidatus Harrisonbacteria bacterium CG10_big_fil_rev_8_21_14_0_10_42_17 TaxID=1974584 RepID=A0A2M6WH70_9BACT|nr:MAG: hypothetical protein COU08_04515 [Candidatus Harrisonbacteria bacterium CG10_big_fil_rev_8_21_14_0_10_42_17]